MLSQQVLQSLKENNFTIRSRSLSFDSRDFLAAIERRREKFRHVPKHTIILIQHKQSPKVLMDTLAALCEGLHAAPISADYGSLQVQKILAELKPSLFLNEKSDDEEIVLLSSPRSYEIHSPCLIFSSSGSTGRPKWIFKDEEELLANALVGRAVQNMRAGDNVLCPLTLAHVGGFCIPTLPALLAGASLFFLEKMSLAFFFTDSFDYTHTVLVPSQLYLLKAKQEQMKKSCALSRLKCLITGSSRVEDPLLDWLESQNIKTKSVYGATEAGPFTMVNSSLAKSVKGRTCLGVSVTETAVDVQEGGLRIKGSGRACYILSNGELVNVRDKDGYIFVKDKVIYDQEKKMYYYQGRTDRAFLVSSLLVAPEEIEGELMNHHLIEQAYVEGILDSTKGYKIKAYVVTSESVCEQDVRCFIKERLGSFKVPHVIDFVQSLPTSTIEKTLAPKT